MATYPFRTALVTGASSGIGEAMARRLAADGVTVIVVARRGDRLDAIAADYPETEVVVADLCVPEDLARVATRASVVDLLVNNAGLGLHGDVVDAPPGFYDQQVGVNVCAVVELTRAAVSGMAERGKGWILNVSSVAGGIPTPQDAAYGASKAFVTSYSDAVGLESARLGVKVTALLPGYTYSEFHDASGSTATPGKPKWMWQTSDQVAKVGLADVASGKARSIPGLHNRAAVLLTRHLPRSIINRIVSGNRSSRAELAPGPISPPAAERPPVA